MKRVIVDTGPLVAFMDRGEPFHAWSVAQLEQVRGSVVSCEAVIAETDYIIRSRGGDPSGLYDRVADGTIEPELRNGSGERTPSACPFGRRARTLVTPSSFALRREEVCATRFSARRRKPHARGVGSPGLRLAFGFNFGDRVEISFSLAREVRAVARLLHRFADQEMQLADACVVRLAELHEDCLVLTTDARDFAVYRRFERQPIPFLAPQLG